MSINLDRIDTQTAMMLTALVRNELTTARQLNDFLYQKVFDGYLKAKNIGDRINYQTRLRKIAAAGRAIATAQ